MLHVSRPSAPRLYCLPKTNKPGKEDHPIVSAVNAPTYTLSKRLTKEFNNPDVKQPSFEIENSLDLMDKI